MAYVRAHDKDSITRELLLTLTHYTQLNEVQLEMERKEKGACVCDNYVSYGSTLTGLTAMLMQPDDCVNCHELCNHIMNMGIHTPDHIITEDIVNEYCTRQLSEVYNHEATYRKWGDFDERVERIIAQNSLLVDTVHSGRAQATVDKWYAKYEARKLELAKEK